MKNILVIFLILGILAVAVLGSLSIFGIISFDFAKSSLLQILAATALLAACSAAIAMLTRPKEPKKQDPMP